MGHEQSKTQKSIVTNPSEALSKSQARRVDLLSTAEQERGESRSRNASERTSDHQGIMLSYS